MNDWAKDSLEAMLKPMKAGIRDGNGRDHTFEYGQSADNCLFFKLLERRSESSREWHGEGIAKLRFGRCWMQRIQVGAWNVIEALKISNQTDIRVDVGICELYGDDEPGEEIPTFSVRVGDSGRGNIIFPLCCCGDALHRERICSASVSPIRLSQLFDILRNVRVPIPMQPGDIRLIRCFIRLLQTLRRMFSSSVHNINRS